MKGIVVKKTNRATGHLTTGILALLVLALSQNAYATEFNIAAGDVPALVTAITEANATAGTNIINLAEKGTYTLTAAVMDVVGIESGLPVITGEIVINGNGSVIERSSAVLLISSIFHVNTGGALTVNDLTVSNGLAVVHGCGGGGICNFGTVTLNRSTIANNTTDFAGGGIFNGGTMTLNNSQVTGNSAFYPSGALAGGILNEGTMIIRNSTLSGNFSFGFVGGIENTGSLVLINSTVSANNATNPSGGGISNSGTLSMSNSTVSANRAECAAYLPLEVCASQSGGIYNTGTVQMQNTVVANQTLGADCYSTGTITSLGYNLDSDGTCSLSGPGDLSDNPDAKLGPLQNNGGPTLTMALLPGSAAIDAGNPNGCKDIEGNLLTTDQRGFVRPWPEGGRCDIGAYELSILYDFSGFYPPVKDPPSINSGQSGRTYPLKWRLTDLNGSSISDLGAISTITYKSTSCTAFTNDPRGAIKAGGKGLKYDPIAQQYVDNWQTPIKGCYTLFLTLSDGQVFSEYFNLK